MKNTLLMLAIFVFALFNTASAREMRFAGQFYPADKVALAKFVDDALDAAKVAAPAGKIAGIVVPHAGYPFSGRVAAFAYKTINTDYDLVVILGTAHTVRARGAAMLAKGYYETPLGRVPVDEALAAELMKASPLFEDLPEFCFIIIDPILFIF